LGPAELVAGPLRPPGAGDGEDVPGVVPCEGKRVNERAVTVKAFVQGSGHGTATQMLTLRVLSPDPTTVTRAVVVRC